MEFSVFRQVLIVSLGHMQSIVEKRSTIPVQMNVKLDVNDKLVLSATNIDLELVESVVADITITGKTTVQAQKLYDLVRKLPDDSEIHFKQDGDQLIVSSGDTVFKLPVIPAENFPVMTDANLTTKFTMTTDDLAYLINKTKFAVPNDDIRYHLGGIYFHIAGDKLATVATDAQKMALCKVPMPSNIVDMPSVILPRRSIGEISKLLEDALVDDVVVELNTTKAKFTIGDAVLITKLVDAQFPDYTVVIPKGNDKVAILDTKKFLSAIDLVSVVSSDKTKSIQLTLSMNKMVISAISEDSGTAKHELDIEYNNDETFVINFNVKFLMDVISQVDCDKVQLEMRDSLAPMLIKPFEKKQDELFVLMPIRA